MANLSKPVVPNGLTGDDILRKAMHTPPPDADPKPPKVVKANRKKAKKTGP
jgi:hypothetical protein